MSIPNFNLSLKKVTEEEIGQFIGKLADELRSKTDFDFRVAQSQMYIAEKDLTNSLDGKQIELYKDFSDIEILFTKLQVTFIKKILNKKRLSTAFTKHL